jgi:nucleotide-binding universal stress UspA family protein
MPDYFKKILVPLDLSINSESAVKKALELADEGTVIHLFYVKAAAFSAFAGVVKRYITAEEELPGHSVIEKKLEQWKRSIEETRDDIIVHTCMVEEESVQKAIEKKATQLAVDLIIIGKNSHHSWFPFFNTVAPGKLAQKTGIGVLTVKPGAIYNKIQTIVVPITNETVLHKREAIGAICRKFRVKVYLVIFINSNEEVAGLSSSFSLLQLYKWVRSTHSQAEYAVLHGNNKARAILNYAEKIGADMLLVQPEKETKISWLGAHISDALPAGSKMQVWAV